MGRLILLLLVLALPACCDQARVWGDLPDPITRPRLNAPVVLSPEGDGRYRKSPIGGQPLEPGQLLGFDHKSGPAIVGYVRALEAEVQWLRSHPAFGDGE